MLVLSRKANESIIINGNIEVRVVLIDGNKVRLGIVAPKDVPVHRQEVHDAIHANDEAPPPIPLHAPKAAGAEPVVGDWHG